MKTLEKIKEYSWIVIISLLALLFLKQCGMSRDMDKIQKDTKKISAYTDSTHKEIKNIDIITREEVEKEMEQVMFQYLIFEDDLDKGKISLSDIRTKIDKNEK